MINIVLHGAAGRMGHTVAQMVDARDDCRIVAGVDAVPYPEAAFPVYATLSDVKEAANVVVDFSNPAAVVALLPLCAQRGLPCVVCTTGLPDGTIALLEDAAKHTAIFSSANMSLGINLLAKLAQRAQAVLKGFDIEIIEYHHRHKLDAPSGTAYMLAEAINKTAGEPYALVYDRHERREERPTNEIGMHAVRGGSIVGRHDILFAGQDETITLSHAAASRDVFASGAIAAALFLAGKAPGIYTMEELLGDV